MSDQPRRLTGADIICVGYGPWEGLWGFLHHVMARLAERNRVLYVEGQPPAVDAPRRRLPPVLSALTGWFRGLRRVGRHLYVLRPPGLDRPGVTTEGLDRRILVDAVRYHQRRLGMDRPILWCGFPTGVHLVGRLNERLVVYHVLDDFACVPGGRRETIRDLEDALLARADLVLAASGHLFRSVMQEHPNAYYVPVAVDVDHFARAGEPDRKSGDSMPGLRSQGDDNRTMLSPDFLLALPRPRVGYVGAVCARKVDVELVAQLARAHPEYSVCLIGPAPARSRVLCDLVLGEIRNVYFLGRQPYEALPGCYAGLDAVIVPYLLNEHTRAIFPPQFIEALAAGKPLVITQLDAIEHYRLSPTLCRVARDRADFLRLTRKALSDPAPPDAADLRREHARRFDLQQRLLDIETLLLRARGKNQAS